MSEARELAVDAGARRSLPATSCFRYEETIVAVRARDEEDLRWLSRFLACGFDELPAGPADRQVELVVDARAYDRLRQARSPGTGALAEGFAKDSQPALFERWPADGSGALYHDDRQPVFYRVSDAGTRVTILAREKNRKCRTALMRVVRELVMDRVVASGGTLLHAAAVRDRAGVVAFSGPKGSGKTTLLLALLRATGARYVANDRLVLRVGAGGVTARGLPTLVSIRARSLEHFPQLRPGLARIRPDRFSSRPGVDGEGVPARFSISPPQLCALTGSREEAGGPLRAIVFPRVTDGASRLTLRRLDRGAALDRLGRGLFRASQPRLLGEVFTSDAAGEAGSAECAARVGPEIVAAVGCFDCELGGGAPPTAEECRALLEEL